jgi:hypothetical protein
MLHNTIVTIRRDTDLDMRRSGQPHYRGRLRRLLTSLLSSRAAIPMGTPRRSIDREQQEYAPLYE